jgi:hypothetical protein
VQRAIEILQGRDLPKPLVRLPTKRHPKREKTARAQAD